MTKPYQKRKNRSLTNLWQVSSLIALTGMIKSLEEIEKSFPNSR